MVGAKGCPTPMVSGCELSKSVGEPLSDQRLYRSVVGALQYATITRPDINFAVNKVSQYMASPLDTHWRAVKRILRYLSGTIDHGIQITKGNAIISAFSDSDWAADLDDRRSTGGYCTYFGKNLISWSVKKQTVVARSSTEAEYRSLAQAASEVSWLTALLNELKIGKKEIPVIWVDNMSAMALASNPVLHARTKHIELDVHFVRDKVLGKEIELRHVPTQDQIADIFTKPLPRQSFVKLRDRLGMVSLSTLGLRGNVRRGSQPDQVMTCQEGGQTGQLDQGNVRRDNQLDQVSQAHQLDQVDVQNDQVRSLCPTDQAALRNQSRSTYQTDQAAVCQSDQAQLVTVSKGAVKVKDYNCTWRDVLLGGLKKEDLHDQL